MIDQISFIQKKDLIKKKDLIQYYKDANHPIEFHLYKGVKYLLSMGLYPELLRKQKKEK